jgi:hypothetical protein
VPPPSGVGEGGYTLVVKEAGLQHYSSYYSAVPISLRRRMNACDRVHVGTYRLLRVVRRGGETGSL